jgi:hypothetical protein
VGAYETRGRESGLKSQASSVLAVPCALDGCIPDRLRIHLEESVDGGPGSGGLHASHQLVELAGHFVEVLGVGLGQGEALGKGSSALELALR